MLLRWRKNFSPLLNVHVVNDVRQTEIHTVEALMPEPGVFEFEMVIEKQKETNHQVLIKSQQRRLKQVVGQFAMRSIKLFILFGMRRKCLRSGRNRSIYCI